MRSHWTEKNLAGLPQDRAAGIQLRLVDSLWPWWDAAMASSVGFSGIRLRNGTGYPYS
jgi:hypothetical protein